ncbi:unnamed protein product [Cladocopium goreaui]|uniref:Prostaglandin F synthase n=1 Tax=Cladocopium goreaui TaxID=2562237 RepID=A0A9P1GK02_9DINO|nr:unnamed protein product [Cladocopium goreaui]
MGEIRTAETIQEQRRQQCQMSTLCVLGSSVLTTLIIMLAFPAKVVVPASEPAKPAAKPYPAACSAHTNCADQQGDCCPTNAGILMGCCSQINAETNLSPFHGMCYAPTPAKNVTTLPTDDYMAKWAQPLWGAGGSNRDDLNAIRQMGFRVLRVYGNDPRLSHVGFLNRCKALGLKVVVAFSDWPYTQDPDGMCATAPPYSCFAEVRQQFSAMLANGFVWRDMKNGGEAQYHPAIEAIILINEPELKITYQGQIAKESLSKGYYTKVLLSALDGALSAESDLKLAGPKPPFTVVHSFSTCESCISSVAGNKAGEVPVGNHAALGFFYDFVLGALKPELFDYKPQHDLKEALQNRWALGFNTQDTSDVICSQVLEPLKDTPLSGLPIWAGEYKAWYQSMPESKVKDFKQDFATVTSWLGQSGSCDGKGAPITGVSLFEFQVSYFKGPGDHQMTFGIYELGSTQLGSTAKAEETKWQDFPVWCRRQRRNNDGDSWAQAAAEAFSWGVEVMGGTVLDDSKCPKDAENAAVAEELAVQV